MKMREGQVGLLLLVIMALVVGIALSLASRSLGDTVLSRQESESAKAFRLAENGVEQALNALRSDELLSTTLSEAGTPFTGSVEVAGQSQYGLYVKEGEMAHLDVTGYVGNLDIYWTNTNNVGENPTSCNEGSGNAPAAIEVIAYKSDGTASYQYRNPYGSSCSLTNGFTAASAGTGNYRSRYATYAVGAGTEYVRIRPIYNNASILVSGGAGLSTQMYVIQSQASGGDAQKEIEVKRGLDAPGSVFDYALFSGSSLEK